MLREFGLDALLTLTTGHLFTAGADGTSDLRPLFALVGHMVGKPVDAKTLVAESVRCRDALVAQYPDLAPYTREWAESAGATRAPRAVLAAVAEVLGAAPRPVAPCPNTPPDLTAPPPDPPDWLLRTRRPSVPPAAEAASA